jgi:hypothetical protein
LVPAGRADLVARIIDHTPSGVLFFDNNVLSARAVVTEAAGRSAEGLNLYRQASGAWAGYGYPLEQAQALLGAARCSRALDLPARALVQQARHILTDLGAAPLLAETAKLLDAGE